MKTERNYTCKMMLFTLVLLVCLTVQVIAHAEYSAVDCIAYVSADTKLNLREQPQGKIIGKLPKGETVTILSEKDRNGYYRIRVHRNNLECYAYGEYLTIQYNSNSQVSTSTKVDKEYVYSEREYSEWENEFLVVTSDKKLNMRKKASRNADRIKYLAYGDRLKVLSTNVRNNYILVKDLEDGKVGYVDIDYVVLESEYMFTKQCCEDSQCRCLRR